MTYALVLHGGAGAHPALDYSLQSRHLADLIAQGQAMLTAGMSALETVAEMVQAMEASGLYVAGKGSAPNRDGVIELDASIMDGATRRAGAIAAIRNCVHPVAVARRVLEAGEQVMLAGEGAGSFAAEIGAEMVADPKSYYVDHANHRIDEADSRHGTVGAVALDMTGNLAAATSTGGPFNKRPGRVGDTPLIGAGTWADDRVAVSCTGMGETFIRAGAAHDVSARMRYGDQALGAAAAATLDEIKRLGGDGGIIAVDSEGNLAMPYNSQGMKRAAVSHGMAPLVRIFEPD